MSTQTTITSEDVGKSVVDATGDEVGIVAEIDHGTAYVEEDPGLTEKLKAKLGWTDRDTDTYPLQEAAVATVTDDEIRLRDDL